MALSSHRWHTIAESQFPWERDALDYLRERLPDQEPFRAWSNFEFIADDGSIYEVDLVVLTAAGFLLIEIKSHQGTVEGDVHTWIWKDARPHGQHPAWSLPLGYRDGVFGAERVPSGAYMANRDMFLFLVDGNRDLDDPTDSSHAGLFRGFILRNSDVGAAAINLDVFLFRALRQSHHLGISTRGRVPAPTRGCVDSGGLDDFS
jgi:hypothetical protein